jgi:transposase
MRGEEQPGAEGINKELRLKRVNRQQMMLCAVDVERLIEPEHVARAIWELVGGRHLSALRAEIEVVEGEAGRPAYDPWLLISLWIYAYSEGVSSAREVARRCEYHPAYQWLTGCEGVNHHSLSDFRVQHQATGSGSDGGGAAEGRAPRSDGCARRICEPGRGGGDGPTRGGADWRRIVGG